MVMKAHVDRERCEGTGLCQGTCPEVFELDDDGKAKVLVNEVPADAEEACREAAENCPTEAISIAD